jgi:hypothetical protein
MPFTPLASDGLGRRSAIVIGSVIMLGGVALQVCATGIGMFVGARITGEFLMTPILVTIHRLVSRISWIWPFVCFECRTIAHRRIGLPVTGLYLNHRPPPSLF